MKQKVIIGADHAGFETKERIKKELGGQYQFLDVGDDHLDALDDFPVFAERVAERVAADPEAKGVLVCGSGAGVSIAANKVPGAYAALAYSVAEARLARAHDNANILATAGREKTEDDPVEIVKAFLSTDLLDEEKRRRRFQQVQAIERKYLKPR